MSASEPQAGPTWPATAPDERPGGAEAHLWSGGLGLGHRGPGQAPPWQRLHPLSPFAVAARALVVYVLVFAEDSARGAGLGGYGIVALGALVTLVLGIGVVRYLFTRWRFDGTTLQIESGVFRRDVRQLPLARVQAVDLARPFFARVFGLAEVRVRLAGHARAAGRLSYLAEPVADQLRAQLLAVHHGVSPDAPQPVETPLLALATPRLIGSTLLSAASLAALALIVVVAFLPGSAGVKGAYVGSVVVYMFAFVRVAWRRVAEQYGFTVALAPDGIRIRRGLFSTLHETVPFARVQAVRKVEPLLWRPFGWCSLEVDVAGSPGRDQGARSGRVTKALLPVGPREEADRLLGSLLGLRQFPLSKPPRRARYKAPARYHFLSAGCDGLVVGSTTGRVCKTSVWLPLEKVQSVRWAQGPLQRRLRLATVVVDAAGRKARAELRDRDVEEAAAEFARLVDASRIARYRTSPRRVLK